MDPIIRNAKPGDAKELKKFVKIHYTSNYPELPYEEIKENVEKNMAKHCDDPTSFVLELNNEIIGYLGVSVTPEKHTERIIGEIHMIHIKKEFRGKGYSHLLMKRAEEYFDENGVNVTQVEVNAKNESAINLYKKHGFKTWRYRLKKVNK